MEEQKRCVLESCGKILVRRSDEHAYLFRKRTSCGGTCARALQDRARRRGRFIKCAHCQIEFWAFPSAIKNGRVYCSRKCKGDALHERTTILRNCAQCEEPFRTKPYDDQQFCSQRCMGLSYTSQVEVTCAWCQKVFSVQSYRADSVVYCSQSCGGKAQAQARIDSGYFPPKVKVICQQCGVEYEIHPYRVKEAKYCTARCRGLALARQMGSVSPTTIEAATYTALYELGIEYLAQHQLGRFMVDAFLPTLNTVIEVQGDYFHCNPAVYPSGPKRDVQRKTIEKDQRRFAALKEAGYQIVQLWERDIRAVGADTLLIEALGIVRDPS